MSLKLFRTTGFASQPLTPPPTGRAGLRPLWLMLLTSLWVATACNLPLWRALNQLHTLDTPRGLLFAAGFGIMIAALTCALLSLLAWRWTLKPAITLLLLSAASGSYFMLAYGVVIDSSMMGSVIETDPREVRDLMNWQLLASVLILAVAPLIWVWRQPLVYGGGWRQLASNAIILISSFIAFAGILGLIYKDFSSLMRNHTQVRYLINPLNSFYSLGVIATKPLRRDSSVRLPIGQDARLGDPRGNASRPPLLVLVLGETARSANFGINGYGRPTTPALAKQNIVSFQNAWSCGTNTAASVPCMYSHLSREEHESRRTEFESLIDVLAHAGLAVLWIDNQSGCKGVCDRTPNVTTSTLKDPRLCFDGECFDEIMLSGIDQRIAALPADRRARGVVVVMHQMGSHGPAYFRRSPAAFKKFMPECATNALQDCPREQVVNAYDNTILYTDHFLSSVIDWLKTQEKTTAPAMMYVSDHGESLGENNLYLHSLPYAIAPDFQKHVPWITWLSAGFEQRTGITTACLKQRVGTRISHDNYFHSVLGLMGVQTGLYDPARDITAYCG